MRSQPSSKDKNCSHCAILRGGPENPLKNADFDDVIAKIWWRHHNEAIFFIKSKTFHGTLDICQVWWVLDQWFRKKQGEVNLPPPLASVKIYHTYILNKTYVLILWTQIPTKYICSFIKLFSVVDLVEANIRTDIDKVRAEAAMGM